MSNQLLLRRRDMAAVKRPNYLKFTALEDGCTLALNKVGNPTDHPTEYSFNKGSWTPYAFGTTLTFNEGDTIEWRRAVGYEGNYFGPLYTFATSGNIYQDGMVTTLLKKDGNVQNIVGNTFTNLIKSAEGFIGSLTLPDNVINIGEAAFQGCDGLKGNLYIPDTVTSIGERAFYNCTGFDGNLHISNSVSVLPKSCFSNCSGLSGSLDIPISVTSIGIEAFRGCANFTGTLVIPSSVVSIGGNAFRSCSGFNALSLPSTCPIPGQQTFLYCSGMTGTLVIPNWTTIPVDVFSRCNFTSLQIANTVITIQAGALSYNGFTDTIDIPYNVTSLGQRAFAFCGSIKKIILPSSITNIDKEAFYSCDGLQSILCNATTPPTLGGGLFLWVTPNFYVPYSADHSILEAYKTANVWANYANKIFELDENGEIPT